jgi:hypothetical protein
MLYLGTHLYTLPKVRSCADVWYAHATSMAGLWMPLELRPPVMAASPKLPQTMTNVSGPHLIPVITPDILWNPLQSTEDGVRDLFRTHLKPWKHKRQIVVYGLQTRAVPAVNKHQTVCYYQGTLDTLDSSDSFLLQQ